MSTNVIINKLYNIIMLKKCFKLCRYSKRIVDSTTIRLKKNWFPRSNFCNPREYKFTLVTSLK